jgi:hypothetical protein
MPKFENPFEPPNWSEIRKTREYKEYMLKGIKGKMKDYFLPGIDELEENLGEAATTEDDIAKIEEFLAKDDREKGLTDEQIQTRDDIEDLRNLEEAKEHAQRHKFDLEKATRELETEFLKLRDLIKYKKIDKEQGI